ncbi:hypothetical protein [Flavobacterium hibisci]|nr:hypothetical protein [Flavobacterium hibisci]
MKIHRNNYFDTFIKVAEYGCGIHNDHNEKTVLFGMDKMNSFF